MNRTSSSKASSPHLLQRRQRVVVCGFGAVAAAVFYLAHQRLSAPMVGMHLTERDGEIKTTRDPYRGVAGTVHMKDGTALSLNAADTLNDRSRRAGTTAILVDMVVSPTLATALEPALRAGTTDFKRSQPNSTIKVGLDLELTLRHSLQTTMQRTALCFTGHTDDCEGLLPSSMASDPRFGQGGLRAAMAAFIVVAEDSGEVLAMGGALSDCAKAQLQRKAMPNAIGRWPIFGNDTDLCAQFPDARHADWIGFSLDPKSYRHMQAGQAMGGVPSMALDPSQWPLPPGSTAKKDLAIACVGSDLMPGKDAEVRLEFARSANNDFFKALALRCVTPYRQLFAHTSRPVELLYPTTLKGGGYPGWHQQPLPLALPIGPTLSAEKYLELDGKAARAGKKRLRLNGTSFRELESSRTLATLAIGDGGHQGYLAQHARTFRELGLSSRGIREAKPVHLARDRAEELPTEALTWMPDAPRARRALYLMGAVTGEFGTAHQACVRVHSACKDSIEMFGKTGTSDIAEQSGNLGLVKAKFPDPVPSKLFVGRFQVAGQWYVVATQALRSRDPRTRRLDESNAAAELALLARRALVRATAPSETGEQRAGESTPKKLARG